MEKPEPRCDILENGFEDAIQILVRENHRIVSKGVYIGIGIDSDGRRTILGFDVQDGESEDNWDTVFQSFVQRGLFGVKLVRKYLEFNSNNI
ncbi:hypothetical protein EfmJHP9_21550 [Enterococcus faecium]|nr:hypothetical protein EfmJHP9_21550 [Enterococcus faecium]